VVDVIAHAKREVNILRLQPDDLLVQQLIGRDVVVAPYVETPLAFARVAGVHREWIADIFAFAPKPDLRYYAAAQPGGLSERPGFVEFAGRKLLAGRDIERFIRETDRHLRGFARLTGGIRL